MRRSSTRTRGPLRRYRQPLRSRVRRKPLPSRFRGGRKTTYRRTRAIAQSFRSFGETIYSALTAQDEVSPTSQIGTTKSYYLGYTLGAIVPTGWTNFLALGGMSVTQGVGTNERTGQWAYLKKAVATLTLDMKPNTSSTSSDPIQFRVIVFKARPGSRNFGSSYSPDSTLMIDTSGQEFGPESSGVVGADVQLQPLNTNRWSIYKQSKFILAPPATSSGTVNSKYASRKVLSLSMPFFKKVRFSSSGEPQDIDTHYSIIILATSVAKFTDANRWEANLRGTVLFNDC